VSAADLAAPSLRAVLALALGVACAATAIALAAGAPPEPAWLAAAGALATLQLAVLVLAARAVPLAVLPRLRRGQWARLALLAAVLQGQLAAGHASGPVALALVVATLVAALLALRTLSEEAAGSALAQRLPRSGSAPRARPWSRAAGALGLALGLLLVAPVLATLIDGAVAALARLDPRAGVEVTVTPAPAVAEPARDDRSAASATDASAGEFPAALEWASSSPLEDDTPVVVLGRTPTEELERPSALHVRGRVLERFTETGIAAREVGAALALDARRDADGWSPLAPGGPPLHEFVVEQIPLCVSGRAETVLFVPVQPVALDCRGALLRGDAELSAPLPARERFAFRVRSQARTFEDVPAAAAGARLAGTRALELPRSSPELVSIRSLAREVTRGAADDRERVARVLAFFRGEFTYEPRATGIAGLAGLVHFLERRAGSCTHYAAAAALMLRTLGLPTRVATGFLALPAADDPDTYVASLRTGHAWFEVAFEGLGWVTCDATPGGSANPALALAPRAPTGGWLAGLTGFLARFAGGERLTWSELVRVVRLPRVGLPVLAALALLGLWLVRRGRGAGAPPESAPGSAPVAASLALERLQRALAQAGFPRPPARTLREHVRALAPLAGSAADPLPLAVESVHRTHFGASPWSGEDEDALRRAIEALRAWTARAR